MMAAKFKPADAPALPVQPHDYLPGRGSCLTCPLPRRNRVHHPDAVRARRQAEYRRYDAARLGERDDD